MAISYLAAGAWQSKTSGTSLVGAGIGTTTTGDLLVIGFSCDAAAGTYTPSDSTGLTWLQGDLVQSADLRTYLWYAFVPAGGTNPVPTVTHPTLLARAMFMARFSGVSAYWHAGNGQALALPSWLCMQQQAGGDALFLGVVGWEGPATDTLTPSASGTPSLTPTMPAAGKAGTTGSGGSSNVTVALAYSLSTGAATSVGVNGTASTTRVSVSAGALFGGPVRSVSAGGGIASGETFGGSPTSAYAPAVLATSGLVGYWRLGESSGTSAANGAGGGAGTYMGGVTLGASGAVVGNTAASFDGTDDYVSVADAAALDVGDTFSAEAWVSRGAGGAVRGIVSKGGNSFYVRLDASGNVQLLKSQVANIVTSVVPVPATGWHHVVATKGGATVKLYIDGADVTGAVTNATLADNSSHLAIGADAFGAAFSEPFNGSIDEVALYNVALTAAQVTAHFTSSGREQSLPDGYGASASSFDSSTVGRRLVAVAAGQVTHIRHWHTTGDGSNTHYLQIYNGAGSLVATANDACLSGPTGWRMVQLATPLSVAAGATFTVAIHTTGWYYTYYTAYPIASVAPSLTTAGSFYLYAADGYPNLAAGGTYLVDVVYVPTPGGGGPLVTQAAPPYPITAVGGVATGYASGTAAVARGVRAVSAVGVVGTGYASGTAVVTRGVRAVSAVGGVASVAAAGVPTVTRGVRAVTATGGVGTGYVSGTAVVARGVRAVAAVGGVATAGSFGLPVVAAAAPGAKSVSGVGAVGTGYVSGVAVVTPGLRAVSAVGAVAGAAVLGTPTVSVAGGSAQSLSVVGGIASGEAFGTVGRMFSATPVGGYSGTYTLGQIFTALVPGRVTHLRYWHPAGHAGQTHTLSLWKAGTRVATVSSTPSDATVGYVEVALGTPYSVAAYDEYRVTVSTDGLSFPATTVNPSSDTALLIAGVGCYAVGTDLYPTLTSGDYYHVDVVFSTGAPSVGLGAAGARSVSSVGGVGSAAAVGLPTVAGPARAIQLGLGISSAEAFALRLIPATGTSGGTGDAHLGPSSRTLTWAALKALTVADTVNPSGGLQGVRIQGSATGLRWAALFRALVTVDASALGGRSFGVVVVRLYSWAKSDGLGVAPNIALYKASPSVNDNFVAADYGTVDLATPYSAAVSYAAWPAFGVAVDFVLNAAGVAAFNAAVAGSGIFKFATANANYDAANVEPTYSLATSTVEFHSREAGLTAAAPAVLVGFPVVQLGAGLSQSISAIGGIGTSLSFGVLSVGRGGTTLTLTSCAITLSVGSVSVSRGARSVSAFSVGSVGFFGGATVTVSFLAITGVGLASGAAFGTASLSLRINAVSLDDATGLGVGIVAVQFKLNEVQSGHYEGSVSLYQIPNWASKAGVGYALFVMGWRVLGATTLVQPIDSHGFAWVLAGASGPFGATVVGMYRAVAPSALSGYTMLRFAAAVDEVHWLIMELAGADTDGTNGAQLIAAGPDIYGSTVSPVEFTRSPYDDVRDVSLQFMRSPGPLTPEAGASASTQQTGPNNVTRAIWKQSEVVLSATTPAPGSNQAVYVNAEIAAADVPTWISGTGVTSAGAFGGGSVANLVWVVSGSGSDFSVPVAGVGVVGLRRVFGVGADFSSPVGAAGYLETGKRLQTYTAAVLPVTSFVTVPAGAPPRLFGAVVSAYGVLVPRVHAARYAAAVVGPQARFAVVYKAKRAVAAIDVAAVTRAVVTVGPRHSVSTVVAPLVEAAVVVVRNEDEVMSERDEFDIGDVARVTATVTSAGVLKDPVSVAFQFRRPDGTIVGTSAVRSGTGVYYGDIPCEVPGRHWWRISGSPDASFGEEGAIRVRRSAVLDV